MLVTESLEICHQAVTVLSLSGKINPLQVRVLPEDLDENGEYREEKGLPDLAAYLMHLKSWFAMACSFRVYHQKPGTHGIFHKYDIFYFRGLPRSGHPHNDHV